MEQEDFDGETSLSAIRSLSFNVDNDIMIAPNPNEGAFTITINSEVFNDIVKIEMMDARGMVVWNKSTTTGSNNVQRVDASKLASGIYFVHVSGEDGAIVQFERIVLQ